MPDETSPYSTAPEPDSSAGLPATDAETRTWAGPRPSPQPAPAPPTVPGYEVLGPLGRGGMGVVYEARQVRANRLVALKMVLGGGLASESERARFRAEAKAIAGLDHPNIVKVFDVGEHDGHDYFALELCPGGSLAGRLDGTPLPPREAAELAEKLARAVAAAHAAGIVHRDLKPGNVLLGSGGEPKVTDFGLAKRLDDDSGQTRTGAVMGTPSYMAPEQAFGDTRGIGPAVDVYALGAILYEMLTGRPPFKGATTHATLEQVRHWEPVPVRALNPQAPRDLETICLKCLQKEPRKRYASAVDLAADLRAYLDGRPIAARPVGNLERAWKWARRRPAVAGLSAALVAVVVAGFALVLSAYAGERRSRTAAESAENAAKAREKEAKENAQAEADAREEADYQSLVAQLLAETAEYQRGEAERHQGVAEERAERLAIALLRAETAAYAALIAQAWQLIATSPGSALTPLSACRWDLRGWEHGYLARVATGSRLTLGHPQDVLALAVGPDGKTLATGGRDGTVRVWSAEDGRLLHSFPVKPMATAAAYSPDGNFLATGGGKLTEARNPGEVSLWDLRTGRKVASRREPQGMGLVNALAFAPDGKRLAVALNGLPPLPAQPQAAGTPGDVRVWEVVPERGERAFRPLFSLKGHAGAVFGVAFNPDGKTIITAGGTPGFGIVGGGPPPPTMKRSGEVKFWDAEAGKEVESVPVPEGPVYAVAFTRDGKQLATGGADGVVRVWDAGARKVVRTLKHIGPVLDVGFDPDGGRVAGAGGATIIWDLKTGREVETLRTGGPQRRVAFFPNGHDIASASGTYPFLRDGSFIFGSAKVWDLRTTGEVRSVTPPGGPVFALAFHPEGKEVAVGCEDGAVRILDAETGAVLRVLPDNGGPVRGVAYGPGGRTLVASAGKVVRLWDAEAGRELRVFRGHEGDIFAVAFDRDGKQVAALGLKLVTERLPGTQRDYTAYTGELKLWDAATGEVRWSAVGKIDLTGRGTSIPLSGLAFSPDGRQLLGALGDENARLWDAATGKEVRLLRGHTAAVGGVAWSPDGKQFATVGLDRTVGLWDARSGEERFILARPGGGSSGIAAAVAFSPKGDRVAASNAEGIGGRLWVWDAATGQELLALKVPGQSVRAVAFSPDGRRLACVRDDGRLSFWDAGPPFPRAIDVRRLLPLLGEALSPDGGLLVTAQGWGPARPDSPCEATVWDLRSGQPAYRLPGRAYGGMAVAFSPDGRWIAYTVGGGRAADGTLQPGEIRLVAADSGKEVGSLRHFRGFPSTLAFSPDGKYVAAGCGSWDRVGAVQGGSLIVWEVESGREVMNLSLADGWPVGLAFAPDGRQLAAAVRHSFSHPRDRSVRVWEVADGRQRWKVPDPTAPGVAFSPDGKYVACGGDAVRVLDAATGKDAYPVEAAGPVGGVIFSPDGKFLVGLGEEGVFRWEAGTGKRAEPGSVGPGGGSCLAFGPDGRPACVVSGAVVWEAAKDGIPPRPAAPKEP